MKIAAALAAESKACSFEFFPPKTDAGVDRLFETVRALRPLDPLFVSVTYGAAGSSRTRTIEIAKRIKRELGIEVLVHVTCVGSTLIELRRLFDELAESGIENVLALRGDPPEGEQTFAPTAGGPGYAVELIELLAREYNFCIGAACYPETHVEATSAEDDLRYLAAKVKAGAQFLISQLFFDNQRFFTFVARTRAMGITVPIVPGIMPITNYRQVARFTDLCGAQIPAPLRVASLEGLIEGRRPGHVGARGLGRRCSLDLAAAPASGKAGQRCGKEGNQNGRLKTFHDRSPW